MYAYPPSSPIALTGISIHGSVIMHASQLASLLGSHTSLDDFIDGNADGQSQFVCFSVGSTCDLNTIGHKSSLVQWPLPLLNLIQLCDRVYLCAS